MGMGAMGMGQMGMYPRGQSATIPATRGQTTEAKEVKMSPAATDSTGTGEGDDTVKGLADALVLLTKKMFVEEKKKKPTMPTKPSEETKKTAKPPKETTGPPKETTEPHKEPMQPMEPRHDSHDEVHHGRDGYPQDPAHIMFNWNPESRPTYDPSAEPAFMRQ